MKVLVAIAVDDGEQAAIAYGGDPSLTREEIAFEALRQIEVTGFCHDRPLWAEIEIPPSPPPIQAEAKETE